MRIGILGGAAQFAGAVRQLETELSRAVALSRVMAEFSLLHGGSMPLRPERLHPVAALMVPDTDGGWRRVSCYRADGPQPVVPGAVSHPLGETAACEPAAAALQDLLRRGRIR